jgi:hypothetical protein
LAELPLGNNVMHQKRILSFSNSIRVVAVWRNLAPASFKDAARRGWRDYALSGRWRAGIRTAATSSLIDSNTASH